MAATYGNQSTIVNLQSYPEFADLVERTFVGALKKPMNNARQMYITDGSVGANTGSIKRYQEIDTETFADAMNEGEDFQKARTGIGYACDMVIRTFGKEVEITVQARKQNRFPEIMTRLTSLASFCDMRMELDMTHILTFGTSTSYTDKNGNTVNLKVGDDLQLLYSTHTLAFNSAVTYSNRVSGDPAFSQGGFEAALLLGRYQTYTNFGEMRIMNWNTIYSSPDPGTCRDIQQFIRSTTDPTQNNPGVVNAWSGFRHIELSYLATDASGAYASTKRRWWGLAAITGGADGWQAYLGVVMPADLQMPSAGGNGEDIHNRSWFFTTMTMYGVKAITGKGIIGSCPTS